MEYNIQLHTFSTNDDRLITEDYFNKYWLFEKEYSRKWLHIENSIFKKRTEARKFTNDFEMLPLRGGLLFVEEDFNQLKACMSFTNDQYFVVIEDCAAELEKNQDYPFLRFIFPSNIRWEEIINGGYLTIELFQVPHRNYFVFGDSGMWCKYVFNDAEFPLDIVGFDPKFSKVFRENFTPPMEELDELLTLVPEFYKESIKNSIQYLKK